MSVVFTVTSVRSDGFNINFANFAGDNAHIYLELNRSSDFASDDTLQTLLYETVAGSQNNIEVRGLPNATPFYIRMFNPSAGGAYSEVQHWATLPLAPDASFAGYSIDPSMIVVPSDVRVGPVYYNGQTFPMGGHPPSNLLLDDPQSTWQIRSNGVLAASIEFYTSGEPIDTVALLGTMAGIDAEISLTAYDRIGGNVVFQAPPRPLRVSPTVGRRQSYHSLIRLDQPRTERVWLLGFNSAARHFLARNLVVGLARQSTNASKGHGEVANDLGTAGRNRFGVIDGVPGWRGRTVDFELSWLREAEYHAKYADLPALVGTTKPVLALVNPKRNLFLQDRIAFGPLTSFRAETPASRRNTVTVEVNSLY